MVVLLKGSCFFRGLTSDVHTLLPFSRPRQRAGGGNDQLDNVSSEQLRWMRQPFVVGTEVHLLIGTDERLFRLAF